jgi:SPP1 family predicted phage head-tail adaptor
VTAAYDPGWLRHRVTFEAAAETADGAGGASLAWNPVATLWARIEPESTAEAGIAEHRAAVTAHRITIRWREDVTGGMRATYRGRAFRILAAEDRDESRRYLQLVAVEERP